MKNLHSFCVVKMEPNFWHAQKEVLLFEKAGAKIKKPKTPLKLRYAKKC